MKNDDENNFLSGLKTQDKMSILLKSAGMTAFEYLLKEDQMIYYNAHLKVDREMPGFLKKLEASSGIHPEDGNFCRDACGGRWKCACARGNPINVCRWMLFRLKGMERRSPAV